MAAKRCTRRSRDDGAARCARGVAEATGDSMTDVGISKQHLETLAFRLRLCWRDAEAAWRDSVHRDFERQLMTPLLAQEQQVEYAMDAVARAIHDARRAVR